MARRSRESVLLGSSQSQPVQLMVSLDIEDELVGTIDNVVHDVNDGFVHELDSLRVSGFVRLATTLGLRPPVTPIVEIRRHLRFEGTAVGLERKRRMRNQQMREDERQLPIVAGRVRRRSSSVHRT